MDSVIVVSPLRKENRASAAGVVALFEGSTCTDPIWMDVAPESFNVCDVRGGKAYETLEPVWPSTATVALCPEGSRNWTAPVDNLFVGLTRTISVLHPSPSTK